MANRRVYAAYSAAIVALTLLLAPIALAGQASSTTPPQFVSPPIHAPEQVQALIKGWLTFAATKAPGRGGSGPSSTPPPSADFSTGSQSSTTPVDAVERLDSYQGETAITRTPSGLLVGGFNSIYPGACSATSGNCAPGATVLSSNGWVTSDIPIAGNLLGFDPSLAADSSTIYYSYGVCSGSCSSGNLMVATSTDGRTWGTGHVVTPPQGGIFDDKPWVAADPTQPGRVYIAWDRNKANNQTILISASNDSGVTWSSPVKVNHGTSKFERVIYAMPAVAPNGTVYVVWMDYARSKLFVAKSTDHGAHWGSTDYAVTPLNITFTDIGCNGGRSMTPAPYIAVDAAGTVYVTYADKKSTTGMDVYMTYSTSGGNSWSSSYRLNDDATATDQYNPAMSVVGTGKVHVSWLDRRNDPTNDCQTQTYSTYTDGSFTGGVPNFSTNTQVIAATSDFDGNPNGPGDYTGNVAYAAGSSTAATPFFPTHLQTDIAAETGNAGGFEAYTSMVAP